MLRRLIDIVLDKVFGRWLDRLEKRKEESNLRKRLNPLVVEDNGEKRYFSWRGRGDVHLIPHEEEPRQLYAFFVPLCQALRQHSAKEPEFNLPNRISGEVVFELFPDFQAKWRLLGGSSGQPGNQVLVLATRP
jgi:hypothetical protein